MGTKAGHDLVRRFAPTLGRDRYLAPEIEAAARAVADGEFAAVVRRTAAEHVMKIARIETTPLALAFKEPYHWAGRVDHAAAVVLVEVETDDGLVGIGESVAAFPAEGTVAALQGVAPLFVGQPVFDIERLITGARHLGSFNHTPWHANFVLAGLEMALWDILGKAAGWPVHRLLGGAVRDEVDYFGFVQGDTTEELVEDARDLAQAGYGVIYLKVGRGEDADLRNTAAVRDAIGGRRLRLDPNCAWSVPEAIHMIGKLREFEPEWIEQPTPLQSIAALRQVKEAVDVPIAADQAVFTPADVYEICRQRAADVIVLSPHEAGGLLAFGKAAAIAEAAGVPVCLHGQGVSGITDAAQHHLGLRTANLTEGNQIMHQLLVEDLVSAPDLTPVQGKLGLFESARPGRRARPGRGAPRGGALPARIDTTEGRRPMKALIADQKLVTELLPMDEAIGVMRRALTMLAEGDVVMPLRQMIPMPGGDRVIGLMPSYLGGLEAVGVKVIAAFPANFGTEYDTHQGVVLYLRHRARPAARHRRRHLDHRHPHRRRERPRDRPAGAPGRRRPGDHRRRHAGAHAPAGDDGRAAGAPRARVQRAGRERRGVRGARIAAHGPHRRSRRHGRGGCGRRRPHLHDDVGQRAGRARRLGRPRRAHQRRGRLHAGDERARLRARRRRPPVRRPARIAAQRSRASSSSPRARGSSATSTSSARSARCSLGKAPGRTSPDEITLFKSLGIAIEDLAAAHHVYTKARERELGTWVEIGGRHFGSAVEG